MEEILKGLSACSCGRSHTTDLKKVVIKNGALSEVPRLMQEGGFKRAFVVADQNTERAGGRALTRILNEAGIPYSAFIYLDRELVPDEQALGRFLVHFDPKCDVIIAVGSGTLNDLARFVSFRLGIPYIIAATAPSMDGYASTVAPLITNSMKTTYTAKTPWAIVADLDVLAESPPDMIAAGFGDILGKFTAAIDWQLSTLINGEYYCEEVAALMRSALDRTLALQNDLTSRSNAALHSLMEALIISGIAMSFVGNSRPASGAEHHLAHYWEMQYLFSGRQPVLHGTKVRIATWLVVKLHEHLLNAGLGPDDIRALPRQFDQEEWEREIRRVYRQGAPEVLHLEAASGKNDLQKRAERLQIIAQRWDEIQKLISSLPPAAEIIRLITAVGGPAYPGEIGLTQDLVHDSLLYAKELRNRYTILQLLWDLGLLEAYAERIAEEVF